MSLHNHNCNNSGSDTVVRGWCSCLEMQWLQVWNPCTLEGEAQYVNVHGSVHWERMYSRVTISDEAKFQMHCLVMFTLRYYALAVGTITFDC